MSINPSWGPLPNAEVSSFQSGNGVGHGCLTMEAQGLCSGR